MKKNTLKNSNEWIDEYHKGVRYGLTGQILIDEKSPFQRITIINSERYGKGLLLDGCWMTSEGQEKHYHECLVHPALCSALNIENILIIGGGDGGSAKECLKYQEVEHLDLVEIDKRVVELSQLHLSKISGQVWKDKRLHLHIENGINWVSSSKKDTYDVVIIDGSDPKGPSKGLFNQSFFEDCKRILRPGGIFATQSESPESFLDIHLETIKIIRKVFQFADPMYGWVPMYPSGWWSWTFASIDKPHYLTPIKDRAIKISRNCEIWSTRWQKGAFQAIPAFIERELNQ